MKRLGLSRAEVRSAAVCLLGGAFATVAMAWGIGMWAAEGQAIFSDEGSWPAPVPAGFPPTCEGSYVQRGWGATLVGAARKSQTGYWQYCGLTCGWPFAALDLERYVYVDRDFHETFAWPVLAPPKWLSVTGACRALGLPTRPMPIGFLGDTLCFAVPIALLWHGPFWVRSRIRLRRGRCIRCGYDLSGVSGKCPECGKEAA